MTARYISLPLIAVLAVFDLAVVALLTAGGSVLADLVLLAGLAGLVGLQVRLWRAGLQLDADGVVVRSALRDTRVGWEQVEGLEHRRNAAGGFLVGVRLAGGEVLLTQGLVAKDLGAVSRIEERFARERTAAAG